MLNAIARAGWRVMAGLMPALISGGAVLAQQNGPTPTTPAVVADAPALPLPVAAGDARVHYAGRFDKRDAAGPRCAWPASSVALRFQGTALNVRLNEQGQDRWQVEVDGKPTVALTLRGGAHLYRVAAGLRPGAHTVRLVKCTEAFVGTTQVQGFQLAQGSKLLPFPAPSHRLEVIGDSISCGYGNEAANQQEHFTAQTENAYFTYGSLAARDLGADYVCVAWSGKKMWPDNTMPELYDRALPQDPGSRWNFARWTPEVVLINLATNDFNQGNPEEAGWTGGYEAFLMRLRSLYPRAEIYCATSPMMGDWGKNKPLTTLRSYLTKIIADRKEAGDSRVHLIDFPTQDAKNGIGADWHPSVKTHEIMAAHLAETLHKEQGW